MWVRRSDFTSGGVGQPAAPLSAVGGLPVKRPRLSSAEMGTSDFLNRELKRRQERNPHYSLRAFARDLDCNHATLSQWLRVTTPMSREAEEHIFVRLDLSPAERAFAREIDDNDLQILAAIREAPATTEAVASVAGMSVDQTNIALAKLLRLEIVRMDQSVWQILEEVE